MNTDYQYLLERIEDLERRLTVVGDESLQVEYTPSGQIISSAIDQYGPEEGASTTSYVSVSYDSDVFTVSINEMPYVLLAAEYDSEEYFPRYSTSFTSEFSKTFKFNKPSATFRVLYIFIRPAINSRQVDSNGLSAYWVTNQDDVTGYDTATQQRMSEFSELTETVVARMFLFNDGTHTITYAANSDHPVVLGSFQDNQRLVVDTTLKRITLFGANGATLGVNPTTISYSEPYDETIYAQFTAGSTNLALVDTLSAGASYHIIGKVKIDSSNNVVYCKTNRNAFAGTIPGLGYTGTFTNADGKTVYVTRGIITNIV